MISFFFKEKILGLDITEEYIRYALVLRGRRGDRLLDAGVEKIARVEPRNALMSAILNIIRKTKCKNANISIQSDIVKPYEISIPSSTPKNFIEEELKIKLKEVSPLTVKEGILFFNKRYSYQKEDFYDVFVTESLNIPFFKSVFENTGLFVKKIVKRKDALANSCIPFGQTESSMVINFETLDLDILVFNPFNTFPDFHKTVNKESVSEEIKNINIDFYKKNQEKISNYMLSGSHTSDFNFLNSLKRFSGLPIKQANVFVNLSFKKDELPILTKDESTAFAVAIGAAIN